MKGFPILKKQLHNRPNEKNIKKANLGMVLEEMINNANLYYLDKDRAVIHKKPTPIQIVKVNYPARNMAVITEAYYKTPSTTDYNGIYRGKYIDFEAKETNNITSFSLANVHPHQVNHLKKINAHGGIGFLLIFFKRLNEVYLLDILDFLPYWDNQKTGRKSIPYNYIKEKGKLVKLSYMPSICYLDAVDEIYF